MSITKVYALRFGSGSPTLYSGLGPTFVRFLQLPDGATLPPPSPYTIGTNPGLYYFTCALSTFSIAFVVDGGAALSASERFIDGILDPIFTVGERVGSWWDTYGATAASPTTVMGFVIRNREVQEGAAAFNKATNLWSVYDRGGTLMLFARAFVNNSSGVTKT